MNSHKQGQEKNGRMVKGVQENSAAGKDGMGGGEGGGTALPCRGTEWEEKYCVRCAPQSWVFEC
jgi:hypothetical protein